MTHESYADGAVYLYDISSKSDGNNIEVAKKAGVVGVATIEEALHIAYEKCGNSIPKITVMPQGANTFPILDA